MAAVNAAGALGASTVNGDITPGNSPAGASEGAHILATPSPRALVEATWAALNTTDEATVPPPRPHLEPIVPPASVYAPPPAPPAPAYAAPAAPPPPSAALRAAPLVPVSMGPLISESTVREAQRLAGGDGRLAAHIRAIAAYDDTMRAAMMMPDFTGVQVSARNAAIANARTRLASASRRHLTPAAVARIDTLLGLPQADPRLGVD